MSKQMSRTEFHEFYPKSLGAKMIITGLATLVEDEMKTPHEAIEIARLCGQETFHALLELKNEVSK